MQNLYDSATPLYKASKILKSDNIRLQNFLFVYHDLHGNLPPALNNAFKLTDFSHDYVTRGTVLHKVKSPPVRTTVFGLRSIKFQSCQDWNFFIQHFKNMSLFNKSKSVCKKKHT